MDNSRLLAIFGFICLVCVVPSVGSEWETNKISLGLSYNKTSLEPMHESTTTNVSTETCKSNHWSCGRKCIHKREYCAETGGCHPTYPIPCGDGTRCYRQVYIPRIYLIYKGILCSLNSHDTSSASFAKSKQQLNHSFILVIFVVRT